ncbi:hypothetical protein F5Y07DRAFT_365183 [Xylaria sp. FL0933]|nr:hypothetical protein F5Y07DRAFT_365183 [Xylaria sp. FL0933]
MSIVHPDHSFALISMPTNSRPIETSPTSNTSPTREPTPSIPCSICENAIQGPQYQCQECGDIIICQGCCDLHPDHILEILSGSPSDGDARPPAESGPGMRASNDRDSDRHTESDNSDPDNNDDPNDDDYQDNNERDNDQSHDTRIQNTSVGMGRGAPHLQLWSSLVARRPSAEAIPPIPQVSLTDEQFTTWIKTAERLWAQSTAAHIRGLQPNGRQRNERNERNDEIAGRQRRSTPHRRWHPEDLERLRALKEDGTPADEIAVILDRSVNAIRQQWRKLDG